MRVDTSHIATWTLVVMLSSGATSTLFQQLEVTLEHASEREIQTRDSLLSLVAQYDVERWISTWTIRIDEQDTPHSHPVLTLHARHLGDDMRLLAVFLHEQFHWWVTEDGRSEKKDLAMAEFAKLFPEVPPRREGGANDAESTWLHMVVCDLEFQAMTALLGEEAARQLMARTTPYPWIYNKLLTDPRLRAVNIRHGLVSP